MNIITSTFSTFSGISASLVWFSITFYMGSKHPPPPPPPPPLWVERQGQTQRQETRVLTLPEQGDSVRDSEPTGKWHWSSNASLSDSVTALNTSASFPENTSL